MEFLYTDGDGIVPTSGREVMPAGEWIALNASAGKIPSTDVFQQALEDRAFQLEETCARPTAWTWTKEPAWFSQRYHWDAWNVIESFPDENDNVPWYFNKGSAPIINNGGKFYLATDLREKAMDLLSRLWLCVESVVSNHPFIKGTDHPLKFNYLRLQSGWDSADSVDSITREARAKALEFLGFLNWWTSSVTRWDFSLHPWMVDFIRTFQLRSLKKRGVFLDLVRNWHHLNIAHLLAEDVPVYYFWMDDHTQYPSLTQLSPRILQAYHDACTALDRTEVDAEEIMGYDEEITTIRRHDEFLQLHSPPDHISSPLFIDIPATATVYIVDFEGWARRPITDFVIVKDYAEKFHFFIDLEMTGGMVTIWRWKPRVTNPGSGQKAGTEGSGISVEAKRGNREIREIFKSLYAPSPKESFDKWGRLRLPGEVSSDSSAGSPNPNASPQRDEASVTMLPRPSWVPEAHPSIPVPRMTASEEIPSRWVQAMSAPSPLLSQSRASSVRRSDTSERRSSRDSRRSASPPTSSRKQLLPASRSTFLAELRRLGDEFAVREATWSSKKPLNWNLEFLDVGFLLIPDPKAQARLRYWAACSGDASSMAAILFKAICFSIPFAIGVKVEDFSRFKPEEVSDMDRLVGKPTCNVEPPFLYTAQGALKAYYMSRVNDVIRRPHARILIGMGGPIAWLGRKWGGAELVAQFMSGPSPDVYVHRRGYIDSDDEHPLFLYTDEMSPQEVDVMFGCIRSDSDKDKSLYPSKDILDDGCFFWTGEWDSRMEDMFVDLTKEILQGTAKFRTPGMWNDYFRRRNRMSRGNRDRLNHIVPASLMHLHTRILDGFHVDWHKSRIARIEIPEEYRTRQIGNRGAL
ncbi:uncharacterized protein LACBIDRAFT_302374 [Laccaria bicolor S238N-H82]|uniref:Predicted protein n=1 Tax=Laccaria bicolor (strain S238N-H82 / ATCC MYA-4686) TaxID=486041 RepID=B0DEP9_LACBS|nr:uncharacterized protein LACBIDRAFT_299435 [Laccaria bicolor S238N-H82]XP_001890928.1 uncharacterized protein LACBIDRAFT_302374 [Laccaria bicolor S238N-H82]EDQ98425.1 predicted protein [Laccaria bicolor S238N-H82]EDR07066.1 predicted protein [Laccaria bicolor S238N-H82]|eukprot:XP_001882439.1 predicted protein [Laccaria bicolor S238N-H82]